MLNWKTHKLIMAQILKDTFHNPDIASCLGFKGGTAAHLFYGLTRYSVDLDFDLLRENDKQLVYSEIKAIIAKRGQIKENRIKRSTIFFLLSYGAYDHNIKIEISTRNLGNNFAVRDYLGIAMSVMTKEDMFANKLIALTKRKKIAMRDIYDSHYFFSHHWGINEKIINLWTKKDLATYLDDCLKVVKKIDNRHILQGLGELIDEKQKGWIKKNLKDDLIFLIKAYQN